MYAQLKEKIESKKAVVGIIGLGYVGLPLALEFHRAGYTQIGFDVDPKKAEFINAGKTYIKHISDEKIKLLTESGKFTPTGDFSRLGECDAILICVPTPLDVNREPDLSFVEASVRQIAKTLRPGQIVSLESTTWPGTTDELTLPILEETGLKVGKDFFLAYSPEREDPGNPDFNTRTIPKVVGGLTPEGGDLAMMLYGSVVDTVVRVRSTREAEMTKLLENIFRSVNIALVNEMKIVGDRMGIDIWDVIDAASSKPFGYMPFYPGPGLGGHCIPIDPFYLTWKAREYKLSTRFIELAGEINTSMPQFVVNKVGEALNEAEKPLKNSKILLLGAAYKKDVDDYRESPSFELIELLRGRGCIVDFNDPHIPQLGPSRKFPWEMKSKDITPENLAEADCVLISTDHSAYDYDFIVKHARLVVDTRNATKNVKEGREKIVKA